MQHCCGAHIYGNILSRGPGFCWYVLTVLSSRQIFECLPTFLTVIYIQVVLDLNTVTLSKKKSVGFFFFFQFPFCFFSFHFSFLFFLLKLKFLQKNSLRRITVETLFPWETSRDYTTFCSDSVCVRNLCFTVRGNFVQHVGFGQFLSLEEYFWKCRILFFSSLKEPKKWSFHYLGCNFRNLFYEKDLSYTHTYRFYNTFFFLCIKKNLWMPL